MARAQRGWPRHRSRSWTPGTGRRRLRVEDGLDNISPRAAVDHRVMRLGDDRPAPTGQAVDLPHLPHRPAGIQPLGHDPQDHGAQLGVIAGWIEHRMVQVLADCEVLAVHPDGSPQVERHPLGPPAMPGRRSQSPGDPLAELVMVRRRTLEDEHRPHVQRLDVGLHPEEPGLQCVEPTVSGHTSSVAPAMPRCPSPDGTDRAGVGVPARAGGQIWRRVPNGTGMAKVVAPTPTPPSQVLGGTVPILRVDGLSAAQNM